MHSLSDVSAFRADLHCHSHCSDGSSSPVELIDLSLAKGLSALAITDHDTVAAYPEAVEYARKKNFLLGTGVEFSCHYQKLSVHVLGYDFNWQSPHIWEYCARLQEKRKNRNREILEKLCRLQMPIEEKELERLSQNAKAIGRPHIAAVMVKKGYVKSIQEAFSFYLGDRECCYVPGILFPVEEAIQVIHAAQGKAFIAHPHLYDDGMIVKTLLQFPFDGIECHYARCPPHKEKRWIKLAKERKLLMSGGSDFHGSVKPHIPLGCSWVDQNLFYAIFQNHLVLSV